MPFIGNKPSAVPLTSADIADGIITNADIANSTINLTTKVTGTLPVANGGTGLSALGSSLQVLRTNTGATALEFATPASGSFVFLAETSASNVASVSLNGYFTSDYDVYKVFIDGAGTSAGGYVRMTVNTTGSYTEQTSGYGYIAGRYADSGGNLGTVDYNYSASFINLIYGDSTTANHGAVELNIYNPMSTTYNKYFSGTASSDGGNTLNGGGFVGTWRTGGTAITGVRFKPSAGNLYARKIRIYGVKNS